MQLLLIVMAVVCHLESKVLRGNNGPYYSSKEHLEWSCIKGPNLRPMKWALTLTCRGLFQLYAKCRVEDLVLVLI